MYKARRVSLFDRQKRIHFLNRSVYVLFAILCSTMLLSIVLYVFVHGIEKRVWETDYISALVVAGFAALTRIVLEKKKNTLSARYPFASERNPALLALLACSCSFVVQFVVIRLLYIEPDGDYRVFFEAAVDLLSGNKLREAQYIALFPHIMGYANFLKVMFQLFCSTEISPFLNVLLHTMSAGLVFAIINTITGNIRHAYRGSLCYGLCPSALLYNIQVLSEPLYTMIILLMFYLLLIVEKRLMDKYTPNLILFLGCGVVFGLLLHLINIIRPVSGILIIAMLIWLFPLSGNEVFIKNRKGAGFSFLTMVIIVYYVSGMLWSSHIAEQLGEQPAKFPVYNVLTGFNQETSGTHSNADADLLMSFRDLPGATAESAQMCLMDAVKERIKAFSLPQYIRLVAEKMKIFAGQDDGGAGYAYSVLTTEQFRIMRWFSNVYYYNILIIALIQTVRSYTTKRGGVIVMVPLYIIGLTLAHILFLEVASRYHYSIVPLIIILGQYGPINQVLYNAKEDE